MPSSPVELEASKVNSVSPKPSVGVAVTSASVAPESSPYSPAGWVLALTSS
jgi:hypothetical protein